MKKVIILSVLFPMAFFSVASEIPKKGEEYMAKVKVLYTMSAGDVTTILIGGEEMTFQGVHLELREVGLNSAISEYSLQYSRLSSLLWMNTDLTKTVRAQVLSQWADVTTRALFDGLAKQDSLNLDYSDSLSDEIYTQNEKFSALRTEQNKLQSTAKSLNGAVGGVLTSLSSLASQMAQLQSGQSAELTRVNEQLQSIARTSEQNKTDTMRAQEQSLKEYAARLAIIEQASGKAKTSLQMVLAKISALEGKVESFVSNGIYTKCWKDVSEWLGWYAVGKEENSGVFLPPPKFNNDGGEDYYKTENGDSIFTMLSDAGVVPVLTKNGVDEWTKLAGNGPKNYLFYDENNRDDGLEAKSTNGEAIPAIKSWADGETITVTGGMFTAKGGLWANVTRSMSGYLGSREKELGEVAADGALAADSLWNTNNVQNPANPEFDPNDMTNPWNKVRPKADAEISASFAVSFSSGTRKSIDYWNKSKLGVAFSLYGFNEAENFCFPYLHSDNANNRELKWRPITVADKDELVYVAGTEESTATIDCEERTPADEALGKVKALVLHGFKTATVGQVAYKKSEEELGWKTVGVKFVGTDASTNWESDAGKPAQTISFASATNSNVKVTIDGDSTNATITIGVYYK